MTIVLLDTNVVSYLFKGALRAQQQAAGRTMAPQDAWIAATALRHQLPLVTHNPSDFQDITGIDVRSIIKP